MSAARQHTPGPWTADIYCVWAGEIFICGTQTGLPVERQIANARLIAAAPTMLAALEATLDALDEGSAKEGPEHAVFRRGCQLCAAQARAAIARATQ